MMYKQVEDILTVVRTKGPKEIINEYLNFSNLTDWFSVFIAFVLLTLMIFIFKFFLVELLVMVFVKRSKVLVRREGVHGS